MILYENKKQNLYISTWEAASFPLHVHTHLELLLCTEGNLTAQCCGQTRVLSTGDLMIAFSGDPHGYLEGHPGKGLLMLVNPQLFPLIAEQIVQYRFNNFLTDCPAGCRELMVQIQAELQGQRDWCILYGYVQLLLGLLLRQLPRRPQQKQPVQDTFSEILAYLNCHYTETMNLKLLAARFDLSASHLSRLFSAHLSVGFLEYLHELRVEHAKYLLSHTGMPISEIQYNSGFTDQKTFNRVFLHLTGHTPRAYRQYTRQAADLSCADRRL